MSLPNPVTENFLEHLCEVVLFCCFGFGHNIIHCDPSWSATHYVAQLGIYAILVHQVTTSQGLGLQGRATTPSTTDLSWILEPEFMHNNFVIYSLNTS